MRTQEEHGNLQAEERGLSGNNATDILVLDLQSPKATRKEVSLADIAQSVTFCYGGERRQRPHFSQASQGPVGDASQYVNWTSLLVKNLPANSEVNGLIPGPGRFYMPWGKALCHSH